MTSPSSSPSSSDSYSPTPASSSPYSCSLSKLCTEINDKLSKSTGNIKDTLKRLGVTQYDITSLAAANQKYNELPAIKSALEKQAIEENYNFSKQNYDSASQQLLSSLSTYCKQNPDNQECKDLAAQQEAYLMNELDGVQKNNLDTRNIIQILINTYKSDNIALSRMNQLIAAKEEEGDLDESNIDNLLKNILTDRRKNFYQVNDKKFINELKYIIIYCYYELLIAYLFVSNFFPNKQYQNFLQIIILIIYIAFPFIVQYIIVLIINIYVSLLKSYDLYDNKIIINN